jgi:hypothetical protein
MKCNSCSSNGSKGTEQSPAEELLAMPVAANGGEVIQDSSSNALAAAAWHGRVCCEKCRTHIRGWGVLSLGWVPGLNGKLEYVSVSKCGRRYRTGTYRCSRMGPCLGRGQRDVGL